MEVSQVDKEIFSVVKEPCVLLSQISFLPGEVLRTPTSSAQLTTCLKNLYNKLNGTIQEKEDLAGKGLILNAKLADYIFVPISFLLNQDIRLTDIQTELIFKLLRILITRCWCHAANSSVKLFSQLFALFIYLLDTTKNSEVEIPLSVESKLAGVGCLYLLLEALVSSNQASLFFKDSPNHLAVLGQLISLVLDLSLTQNAVLLQKNCLLLLQLLYTKIINDGEMLSHVLPGNVSKLTKLIAQKDGISTHYTVLVESVNLLSTLISKVFNDFELHTQDKTQEVYDVQDLIKLANDTAERRHLQDVNNDIVDFSVENLEIPDAGIKQHRTSKWLHATSQQVKLAIPIIVNLKDHQKFEVREALLEFCESVIKWCSKSLRVCLTLIVDCLSFLNNEQIFHDRISLLTSSSPDLVREISRKLDSKITLLPVILASSNQDKITAHMNSLSFYLKNYTNKKDPYLLETFTNTLTRSIYSYINAETGTKKFKAKNIQLVAKPDSISTELLVIQRNTQLESAAVKDELILSKFYDSEVELAMSKLLQNLGSDPEWLNIFAQSLPNNSNADPLYKSISLWIINNMLKGYVAHDRQLDASDRKDTLDEFLVLDEPDLDLVSDLSQDLKQNTIYLILESASDFLQELSQSDPDMVVSIEQSITLDTIGQSAMVLKELFKDELIDHLYPVVDSLASTSEQIRLHAQQTSLIIANECYNGSLRELIYDNSDYLMDSLSLKLTSESITPRTSAVLLVLIQVGGLQLVTQLNDIVHTMFTLLDLYHGYDLLSEGFFVVFNSIIDKISDGFLKDYNYGKLLDNVENFKRPWAMSNLDQVLDIIDSKKRDLSINLEGQDIPLVKHPNKPFGELPDSDDEDEDEDEDDDDLALMKEIDNYQLEKQKEEQKKWDSHIPSDLYFLVQQILSYGDRLILMTDSLRLQARILDIFNKVVPILSTSPKNLLPVLADIWPLVLRLCIDDDVRVVSSAIEVAHSMIDFGGDFMTKKFSELWTTIHKESNLLTEYSRLLSSNESKSVHLERLSRFQDNSRFKTYFKMMQMLVLGIEKLGTGLPNSLAREIIEYSVVVIPEASKYGYFSDVAWLASYKRFDKLDRQTPNPVVLSNGETFVFNDFM